MWREYSWRKRSNVSMWYGYCRSLAARRRGNGRCRRRHPGTVRGLAKVVDQYMAEYMKRLLILEMVAQVDIAKY